MVKTKSENALPQPERESASWSPMKLVGMGIVTLIIALSIIITLGSRLGGCMYLDGSHGAGEYDKSP